MEDARMSSPLEKQKGPARAAPGDSPPRDGAFRTPWMIAIAAVFALNFLLPRSYLIFGVDHVSFLPLPFQIAWTGLALAAVAFVPHVARNGVPRHADDKKP